MKDFSGFSSHEIGSRTPSEAVFHFQNERFFCIGRRKEHSIFVRYHNVLCPMKKFLLLLAPLFALSFFVMPSFSQNDYDVIEIDINYTPPVVGPVRYPVLVPITATYYVSLSYIDVVFTDNIGDVTITLSNLTTGGYVSSQINSGFGGALVPVTLGSGNYRIDFSSSGGNYYGTFTVL